MSARYPRRVTGVVVAEADGAWVIRQPGRGRVHYLNAAAALALELCTGATEWEALVERVCAAAGAPPEAAPALAAVLQQAADAGLIVIGPAPAP